MNAPWWEQPFDVIDTESTGLDLETVRIVQAARVSIGAGRTGVTRQSCTIVNPGVPIPEAAVRIHGITTERAQAEGHDPAEVIGDLVKAIESNWLHGTPVVIMKAPYDLTLLDREMRRHHGRGVDFSHALVLDPLAIDRACDPFRPGKRKLVSLAAHFGVTLGTEHDALGDCMSTARVLYMQARARHTEAVDKASGRRRKVNYNILREMSLQELQTWQADRHAAWAANYQEYLRGKGGKPDAVVDHHWPYKPLPAAVPA